MKDKKTGVVIPYPNSERLSLIEWRCPACCHRWWEYSDELEEPVVCPLCGLDLDDSNE